MSRIYQDPEVEKEYFGRRICALKLERALSIVVRQGLANKKWVGGWGVTPGWVL